MAISGLSGEFMSAPDDISMSSKHRPYAFVSLHPCIAI